MSDSPRLTLLLRRRVMPPITYHLNPMLDRTALRESYARHGRVRIPDLLRPSDAIMLRDHLAARSDWRQVLNSGEKVFELDRETRAAMTAAQSAALDDAVAMGARAGFQYRYESIRVPDGRADRAVRTDPLTSFARWLSGDETMALLADIIGDAEIRFADSQATAYAPGDLLTAHDDEVAGKNRRAAYVFGLNPQWRAEWGGLLLFHDPDGSVDGRVPAFNTLDLFAVPQAHSVSHVHAAAPLRRYSITGWLRAQPQPA